MIWLVKQFNIFQSIRLFTTHQNISFVIQREYMKLLSRINILDLSNNCPVLKTG